MATDENELIKRAEAAFHVPSTVSARILDLTTVDGAWPSLHVQYSTVDIYSNRVIRHSSVLVSNPTWPSEGPYQWVTTDMPASDIRTEFLPVVGRPKHKVVLRTVKDENDSDQTIVGIRSFGEPKYTPDWTVPSRLHGKVLGACPLSQFQPGQLSMDGRFLVYLAEAKIEKEAYWWNSNALNENDKKSANGGSEGAESVDDGDSKFTKMLTGKVDRHLYENLENFGEQEVNVMNPVPFLIDLKERKSCRIPGLPPSTIAKEVVFTAVDPETRTFSMIAALITVGPQIRYGNLFCFNRPASLFFVKFKFEEDMPLEAFWITKSKPDVKYQAMIYKDLQAKYGEFLKKKTGSLDKEDKNVLMRDSDDQAIGGSSSTAAASAADVPVSTLEPPGSSICIAECRCTTEQFQTIGGLYTYFSKKSCKDATSLYFGSFDREDGHPIGEHCGLLHFHRLDLKNFRIQTVPCDKHLFPGHEAFGNKVITEEFPYIQFHTLNKDIAETCFIPVEEKLGKEPGLLAREILQESKPDSSIIISDLDPETLCMVVFRSNQLGCLQLQLTRFPEDATNCRIRPCSQEVKSIPLFSLEDSLKACGLPPLGDVEGELIDKVGYFAMRKQQRAGRKRVGVFLHGGPNSTMVNSYNPARAFYIVAAELDAWIAVHYRGSTGYDFEFLHSLAGHVGFYDVEDCRNAALLAIARCCSPKEANSTPSPYTLSDLEFKEAMAEWPDVILIGGSHGGFLATHLAGSHPDLPSVALAMNPVTDAPSMSRTSDIADIVEYEMDRVSSIDIDPKRKWDKKAATERLLKMWESSPMYHVGNVKCPVVLGLGGKDVRVPWQQGMSYYKALKELGCDTECYLYPEDNHSISIPRSLCHLEIKMAQFANRRLAEAESRT